MLSVSAYQDARNIWLPQIAMRNLMSSGDGSLIPHGELFPSLDQQVTSGVALDTLPHQSSTQVFLI